MEGVSNTSNDQAQQTRQLLVRNTALLLVAKVLATPIAIGVNAVLARFIGPEGYGYIYLATTFCSFAFLLVSWGQNGSLPAMLARDHSQAGVLFGSGLAWRVGSAIAAYAALVLLSFILDYPREFQIVLALVYAAGCASTLYGICQDVARGFERTDLDALASVLAPILFGALVIPILYIRPDIRLALLGQLIAETVLVILLWRAIRKFPIGKLTVQKAAVQRLVKEGWPFMFFGLALALQPNIDAVFLSKLAPAEVVGWHAAARKLIGLLVFPASALMTALYPMLCRLSASDPEGFRRTSGDALSASTIVVVPLALCCALFPDVGIRILSEESFGPAEHNLQILALFVFLVYFTMVLGSALLAAGRQREWVIVQCLCVLVSVVFDPLLVPWFQERYGNGGLGICIASVISELVVLIGGIILVPRGTISRPVIVSLFKTTLAGLAMVAVARALHALDSLIVAPIALVAYVAGLWITGALRGEQVAMLRVMISRKANRA